jgi:transposase
MPEKKATHMSSDQRREVVQRYQAGERAVDIAWSLGYSSAAIYRILRNYKKIGDAVFEVRGSGTGMRRPTQRLDKKHIDWLKTVLPTESPRSMGIDERYDKVGKWTAAEIKKLLVKERGVAPSHDECMRAAEQVGVRTGIHLPSRFKDWKDKISADYVTWRESDDANKLRKRESKLVGSTTPPLGGASFRGRIPFDDIEWREHTYHFQLDDPLLTAEQGEAASRHLMAIRKSGKKS